MPVGRRFRLVGAAVALSLALLSPAIGAGSGPQSLAPPALPIAVAEGSTVVLSPARWSVPVKRSFQWFVNGKPVAGATGMKLKLQRKWTGATVFAEERAVDGKKGRGLATSNPVVVGRLVVSGTPVIKRNERDARELTVTLPTVQPNTVSVRYLWLRNGFDVEGARSASYMLTPADRGAAMSVQVSFVASGYRGLTIESNVIDIPDVASKYDLLWSDEFSLREGALPDDRFWVAQQGDGRGYPPGSGWGNAERQYYLADLARHDGAGNLIIRAKRAGASQYSCWYSAACEWVSSKYVTQDKLTMKYGRVDIRMKATAVAGTWPAFWLLGTDFALSNVRWPKCGELDVVELLGREPRTVHGTTHGPLSAGPGRGGSTSLADDFSKDFHTYRMDWTENQVSFFVDDRKYVTIDKYDADWVFDHEFFFLINLAMGGNWGGAIDPQLTEAQLIVDFIRIYSIDGLGEVFQYN